MQQGRNAADAEDTIGKLYLFVLFRGCMKFGEVL